MAAAETMAVSRPPTPTLFAPKPPGAPSPPFTPVLPTKTHYAFPVDESSGQFQGLGQQGQQGQGLGQQEDEDEQGMGMVLEEDDDEKTLLEQMMPN